MNMVTVAGLVAPGTAFDPDRNASAFWALHAGAQSQVERVLDDSSQQVA